MPSIVDIMRLDDNGLMEYCCNSLGPVDSEKTTGVLRKDLSDDDIFYILGSIVHLVIDVLKK